MIKFKRCIAVIMAMMLMLTSLTGIQATSANAENLARGCPAVATYEQSNGYNAYAGNVTDGDLYSRWSTFGGTGGQCMPAAIQIDLQDSYAIERLVFYWFGTDRIFTYNVYVTDEPMIVGKTFTKNAEPTASGLEGRGSGNGSEESSGSVRTENIMPSGAQGRYLTVEVTGVSSGGIAAMWELEVYGVGSGEAIPTVYKNLSYAEGSSDPYQTLDINLPNGGAGPFPVLVYAHGGAWVIGEKAGVDEARVFLETARREGYAVVSINYRLAQNAKWPAQIYDYKAAVRYLRANAEKYHLDPDRIAAAGASAGAHLAQLMGTTNGRAEYEDLSMGNAEYSSDVQAVVSQYGISDLTQWSQGRDPGNWMTGLTSLGKPPISILLGDNYTDEQAMEASSYWQADENTVPMILAHGQNDNLVEPEHSRRMEEKLKTLIDPELIDTYYPPNGPHGDGNYWNQAEPVKKLMNFLNKRFMPEKNIESDENTRPPYWHIDLSGYKNKYLNLKYANDSDTQKLHLVLPEKTEEPVKTIVFVHGGGFAGGNSNNAQPLYTAEAPLHAVKKGYAVALVDYRYSPEGRFPLPIYDVKAAIRYLRANAEKYGLDSDKFAVWGESAGGLIADMIAVTGDNPEFEDLSMGNAEYSSAVQAAVSFYAITDMTTDRNAQYRGAYLAGTPDTETLKKASPLYNVTKNAPPFYLQHGMADHAVEYSDSVRLYEELVSVTGNKDNKLELFPGLTHAVKKFLTEENTFKVTDWLDGVLDKPQPQAVLGDVDRNGSIDINDLSALKAAIMAGDSGEEIIALGDMDKSGTIDVNDMTALKNVILSSGK